MQIDRTVATVARRLAGYEGRTLSAVLGDALDLYLRSRWPGLDLAATVATSLARLPPGWERVPAAVDLPDDERRTGAERRGTKRPVGRPASVADRRTKKRRSS